MIEYFCTVCRYFWAAFNEPPWCPKCKTNDIERSEDIDEPIPKS